MCDIGACDATATGNDWSTMVCRPMSLLWPQTSAWLIEPVTAEFGRDHLRRLQRRSRVSTDRRKSCERELDVRSAPQDGRCAGCSVGRTRLANWMPEYYSSANEVRGNSTFDKAAAIQVIGRMTRADRALLAPNVYFSPREMMSIIGCCDLTISMRYHFCLFSALQGVPFIAIERSDKVSDLCWDIDWPARVAPPHFERSRDCRARYKPGQRRLCGE